MEAAGPAAATAAGSLITFASIAGFGIFIVPGELSRFILLLAGVVAVAV